MTKIRPMSLVPNTLKGQILLVWGAVVFSQSVISLFSGSLGHIGPDSDDVIRLVQIRDLYTGQSWFDLTQYRMGPEGGTLMHWSRLVDLPIVALMGLFDLFLPYIWAEKIAISIWPPLSSLFVIWGVLKGAHHIGGEKTPIFAVLLLLFLLIPHHRFSPGAIDHHNLQLGAFAIAIGYLFDPKMSAKSFGIAGLAMAISMAIGIEVIIFIAVLCAFVAINWLIKGANAKRGTIAFGLGFSLTTVIIFFTTIAPQNYGIIACDAFSVIMLYAAMLGGLGLSLMAFSGSQWKWTWRLGALIGLGLLCIVLLGTQAPQCLSNPLDNLPPEAHTLWLDHINEAQPLFADKTKALSLAPYAIGTSFLALVVCLLRIRQNRRPVIHAMAAAVLVSVILLTIYQVRFHVFGAVVSVIILSSWVGDIYVSTKAKSDQSVVYIMALALSLPFVWGFPGLMLTPVNTAKSESEAASASCYSEAVFEFIGNLPTGRFAITSNGTAPMLQFTSHSAMSGNYHRNTEGMLANIHIFTRPPNEAEKLLEKYAVDYVFMCRETAESLVLAKHNQHGLMAHLLEDNVPEYLIPIPPDLEDGNVRIFRFTDR